MTLGYFCTHTGQIGLAEPPEIESGDTTLQTQNYEIWGRAHYLLATGVSHNIKYARINVKETVFLQPFQAWIYQSKYQSGNAPVSTGVTGDNVWPANALFYYPSRSIPKFVSHVFFCNTRPTLNQHYHANYCWPNVQNRQANIASTLDKCIVSMAHLLTYLKGTSSGRPIELYSPMTVRRIQLGPANTRDDITLTMI